MLGAIFLVVTLVLKLQVFKTNPEAEDKGKHLTLIEV